MNLCGGLYAPAVFSTCAQMRLRSRPAGEVSPRVTGEPDYFVEDLSFSAIGFLRGRLQ